MKGGLDRHEALHAIGSVVMEHIMRLSKEPTPDGDLRKMYFDAVDALTAKSWRRNRG